MAEVVIFSSSNGHVTPDEIERLTDHAAATDSPEGSLLVSWNDVQIRIRYLSPEDVIRGRAELREFACSMNTDSEDGIEVLLERIAAVRNIARCNVEPVFDSTNKATGLLVSIARSFDRSFLLSEECLYDDFGRLWFGPPDTEPFATPEDALIRQLDPRR